MKSPVSFTASPEQVAILNVTAARATGTIILPFLLALADKAIG